MQFQIPKPCHENWDQMTATEKGRICDRCACNVYDFTTSSHEELEQAFIDNHGQICGKVNNQLLAKTTSKPSRFSLFFSKKIAATLLTFLSFSFLKDTALFAQHNEKENPHKKDYSKKHNDNFIIESSHAPTGDSITIKGLLVENTGEPILFANIHVEGTNIGTTTDFDGHFSLNIPLAAIGTTFSLQFSYVGLETLEVRDLKPFNMQVRAEMNENPGCTIGIIIHVKPNAFELHRRSPWNKTTILLNEEEDWDY